MVQDQLINKPVEPPKTYEYQGFWIRLTASLIDGFIIGAINFVLTLIFIPIFGLSLISSSSGIDPSTPTSSLNLLLILSSLSFYSLVQFLVSSAYFVGLTSKYGATFGKKAVGIKVIDDNGNNISVGSAILREVVGKWISVLILGIGYIMVAFDDKKQGLHDKIAGTYVVKN